MNQLFQMLKNMGDQLEDFLAWAYQSTTDEVAAEVEGFTPEMHAVLKNALESGIDPTDLQSLENTMANLLSPPVPVAKSKPWEKVKAISEASVSKPAQVELNVTTTPTPKINGKPSKAPVVEQLGVEDLRDMGDEALREEIVDLFFSAYKRHSLPFKISSDESKEQVSRMMARIRTNEEPVSLQMLSKWVDGRFSRIADARTAGDRVRKDLGNQRVGELTFGCLCGMIRDGSYSEQMAQFAAQMAQDQVNDQDAVSVLERTAAYGGTKEHFARAYRRVIGDTPIPRQMSVESTDQPTETAMAAAFNKKKAPWSRG